MEIDEIFDTFGVEVEGALYIERVFIPSSVTFTELINYSKRMKKNLNIIKRPEYVYAVDGENVLKKNYGPLSKKTKRRVNMAIEKSEKKNAGYSRQ